MLNFVAHSPAPFIGIINDPTTNYLLSDALWAGPSWKPPRARAHRLVESTDEFSSCLTAGPPPPSISANRALGIPSQNMAE